MFGKREINRLGIVTTELRSNIDWLAEKIRKVEILFKPDRHGTIRPKVDMLKDDFNNFESNYIDDMERLFERIEKLEKK